MNTNFRTNILKYIKYGSYLVFTVLMLALATGSIAKASETTITIKQEDEECDYEGSTKRIKYNGTSYSVEMLPLQIHNTWMVPSREILHKLLGCSYSVSESEDNTQLTIKNPDRTVTLQFVKDSTSVTVNGKMQNISMPMLKGSSELRGLTDFYLPFDFVMKSLGYSWQNTTNAFVIDSYYIYTAASNAKIRDQTKYRNILNGITIGMNTSNTQNYVLGLTANSLEESDISYLPNTSENSITMKFSKTQNALGTMTKEIHNGIISTVKIWDSDSEAATYIKVFYSKKYIYTQKTTSNGGKVTFSKEKYSMKILLPKGVNFSQITTTDQYWKKRFLIVIPGNHIAFYKKNKPLINDSSIVRYSVSKTASGNTRIIVKTSKLRGYKLSKRSDYFTVTIGSPQSIYKNIVLLDAGHGGFDLGAKKRGVTEKKLNLNILYTQAKKYFESNSSDVKAYWTRRNDTFVNLYQRPKYVKKYGADLFVSLHMNSCPSSRVRGLEVYYSRANTSKMSGITSKMFAKEMCNTLVKDLSCKKRGVKQAGFVVIKHNTVPAILIELGFLTNSSDRNKLKSKSYQKKAAKSIYRGISDIFKKR
ncbi:MAG: N-acetylmuramoyl-L-alanine amidase [Butyribacter sp.]|nr:N-acetylmuramoyl-L-alanine amidase [bacterium]MDY3853569.1 N-acetylmuramoyl-L-alanine amidase [Butyribacter sp.]